MLCLTEVPVFNASKVDSDQMPCFAMSDLGLHCFKVTLFRVSGLKTVKD